MIIVRLVITKIPADLLLGLWAYALTPSQDPIGSVTVPTTVVGLVGAVVMLTFSFAGIILRGQLAERKENVAEIKALSLAFVEATKEMQRKHEEEGKAEAARRHEIDARLLDVIVGNTTSNRELARAVENFIPLQALREEVRNSRGKAVR